MPRGKVPLGKPAGRTAFDRPTRQSLSSLFMDRDLPVSGSHGSRYATGACSHSSSGGGHAGSASGGGNGVDDNLHQMRSSFASSGADRTPHRYSHGSMEGSTSPTNFLQQNTESSHNHSAGQAHQNHHHHQRGSLTSQRGSTCSKVSSLTRDSSIHDLDPLKIEISDLTHIVGRSTEQELLQSAFVRVLKQEASGDKKKEIVMVHGKQGTGKTALVLDFKDAVSSTGTGYFCSGKFEKYQAVASPYSGIVQALNDLCESISVSHDKEKKRVALYQNLGHARLQDFIGFLPKLKVLLYGSSTRLLDEDEDSDYDKEKNNHDPWENRTHELPSAFRDLLRVLSDPVHPTIMLLDDLQWADSDSLDCLSSFVQDKSLMNFMLVGAYRDDLHCKLPFLAEDHGHTTTDIRLENLSLSSVDDILSDLTGTPGVKDLATIVLEKTHGNPFSIFQFLEMLQRKELLVFSFHHHRWIWDVEEIKSKTEVTQNVGHTLVENIDKLSREGRKLLTLASVIGFSFDPKVLELIATHLELLEDEYREHLTNTVKGVIQDAVLGGLIHPDQTHAVMASQLELVEEGSNTSLKQSFYEETIEAVIQEAEVEGLISKAVSRSKFKFSHDIVHKSLYEYTTLDFERQNLHLQIGRVLRSFYSVRPEDDLLFASVDHLNKGSHFVDDDDERINLIQLNQQCSEKARAKSALFSAASFSSKAIDLLKFEYDWMNHYDLLLHVYNDAAELNFACGRFDLSLRRCLEIHRHARNLEDKLLASYIRVEVLYSQQKIVEAIHSCMSVLESLGEPLDKKPSIIQIMSEWRKTRKLLKGCSAESWKGLPEMEDPIKRQAQRYMSLLVNLTVTAIDDNLLAIAVLRMLQNALQYGSCDYTPFAIAGYGMLCTNLGTFEEALEYGKLALGLCEQRDSDICVPGTYILVFSTLEHFGSPLLHGVEPLLKAYRIGLGNGEVQYAAACTAVSAGMGFHCALPLKPFAQDLKNVCDQLKLLRQESIWSLIIPYWQAALDLSGGGTEEERASARNAFAAIFAGNDSFLRGQAGLVWRNYHMMAYIVLYLFNDYEAASDARKEMTRKSKTGPKCGHFMVYFELFFSGLLDFALCRSRGSWMAFRRGKTATKKMQKFVKSGAVNCRGMLLLLRAEFESFGRNFDLAKRLYEDSMKLFSAAGYVHFNALANEKMSDYMRRKKKPRFVCDSYLRNATKLYAEWGAAAKVGQLVEVHHMPARFSMGDTPCPVITIHGEKNRRFTTPIEGQIKEEDFMSSDFISSDLFTARGTDPFGKIDV